MGEMRQDSNFNLRNADAEKQRDERRIRKANLWIALLGVLSALATLLSGVFGVLFKDAAEDKSQAVARASQAQQQATKLAEQNGRLQSENQSLRAQLPAADPQVSPQSDLWAGDVVITHMSLEEVPPVSTLQGWEISVNDDVNSSKSIYSTGPVATWSKAGTPVLADCVLILKTQGLNDTSLKDVQPSLTFCVKAPQRKYIWVIRVQKIAGEGVSAYAICLGKDQ